MKNKVLKLFFALAAALVISASFVVGCAVNSKSWFEKTIKSNYYYTVPDEAFEGENLKEIANKYLDIYSAYYTAEEYKSVLKSNSGSKSGIGISYSFAEGKGVFINSVTGNSPAYISGLRAGEWLKSGNVGGEETPFDSANDFSALIASVGDGENINLTAVGGETYTVAKAEYTASYTYMATNKEAWVFADAASGGLSLVPAYTERITGLPDGTAYINISQFYGTAAKEFDILVKKFNAEGCTSLIIDLRSNGGGYVSVMQDMAYAFSGSGKRLAMLARYKNGKEDKFYCTRVSSNAGVLSNDTKVYVLANSGTASASEALIGAMVCYGSLSYENIFLSDYSEEYMSWLEATGQELKTARSYGKGIMQSTFENKRTKEALKLTTAKIFWPDGITSIHDVGLTTENGCTAVPALWQHTKADEELYAVIDIIQSRN